MVTPHETMAQCHNQDITVDINAPSYCFLGFACTHLRVCLVSITLSPVWVHISTTTAKILNGSMTSRISGIAFYNHYYLSPPLSNAPPTAPHLAQDLLICTPFSIILSFQVCYINGIIYYITFWNWLFFTENNSLEINPRLNQQCFLLLSSIPWCGYTVQPFACGRSNFGLLGVVCHVHSWTGFVCVCEHKPPFL